MAFSKPLTYQDHQISTRGLYSSKFTVPPCSCFDIFSDLQIPWECQHHFTQQKPSPRRGLPSGQERTCHSSSARKVPCCLEYNPRMPWDAVFACMARHAKQFWDNEVRRPAFQFITRGSSRHSWHPWSLWALPHKISLPHQGSVLYRMEVVRGHCLSKVSRGPPSRRGQ